MSMNKFICMLNPNHPSCGNQNDKQPTDPYWDNYTKLYGGLPEAGQKLTGAKAWAHMSPEMRNQRMGQIGFDPTTMSGVGYQDAMSSLIKGTEYEITPERISDFRANQGLPGFNFGSIMKGVEMMTPEERTPQQLRKAQEFTNPGLDMSQINVAQIGQPCNLLDIECQKRQAQNRGIFNAHRSV